tara:strand:+ start:59 stop:940 length:882 start_codon:yes stop_codon:yes gene_type:complete
MKKIYFAPNWGLTSEQMIDDYVKQTPENTGRWNDIVVVSDPVEAEYLIIQDQCDASVLSYFDEDKRLYFSREAMDSVSINSYPNTKKFSYWDDTGFLWTKWWYPNKSSGGINKTYDELTKEDTNPYDKNKLLSCVQSDKTVTEGHILRYNFLVDFMDKSPELLDLYGSINFSNKDLKDNDKFYALSNYKYCLAFDNQDTIKNFFGTQFTDSILYWTIPIYWGGAELDRFFPKNSFIQIDIRKSNELDRVIDIIKNDDYEFRLPALKEARELILNKYNMWPMIDEILETGGLDF